ncbi:MAG: DUF1838 family protein [Rhodospirillaceae bacterium]|nr:DUF1838 family protein [Rhodospirillaceae bacterium]
MLDHIFNASTSRRTAIGCLALPVALTTLARSTMAQAPDTSVLDDTSFHIRTFARLGSTLETGKTGYVLYKGKAFAVDGIGAQLPIYGIEGLAAIKLDIQSDGTVRFLFSEAAIYTDLASGEPLETWKNPYSEEVVPVWHQRNGPVNFAMSSKPSNKVGAFETVEAKPAGFRLPWIIDGDMAMYAQDTTSNRPNPIKPDKHPQYSVGETLYISEHTQYSVKTADLFDKTQPTLNFFAALQSLKPWHPWMKMGRRPGRVFTRMISKKAVGLQDLTKPVQAYVEKNLAQYVVAPATWTGEYIDAYRLYKEYLERS